MAFSTIPVPYDEIRTVLFAALEVRHRANSDMILADFLPRRQYYTPALTARLCLSRSSHDGFAPFAPYSCPETPPPIGRRPWDMLNRRSRFWISMLTIKTLRTSVLHLVTIQWTKSGSSRSIPWMNDNGYSAPRIIQGLSVSSISALFTCSVSELNLSCSVSLVDEARRWFESSTVICRYVPGGPARAEKVSCLFTLCLLSGWIHNIGQISGTYTELLSRFQPDADKSTDLEPS